MNAVNKNKSTPYKKEAGRSLNPYAYETFKQEVGG